MFYSGSVLDVVGASASNPEMLNFPLITVKSQWLRRSCGEVGECLLLRCCTSVTSNVLS